MPNLFVAHVTAIHGYTRFDCDYLRDDVSKPIIDYLLGPRCSFKSVLIDRTHPSLLEFARIIAKADGKRPHPGPVLELSLLNIEHSQHATQMSWPPRVRDLPFMLHDRIREVYTVYLAEDVRAGSETDASYCLLAHVFPEVASATLLGPGAASTLHALESGPADWISPTLVEIIISTLDVSDEAEFMDGITEKHLEAIRHKYDMFIHYDSTVAKRYGCKEGGYDEMANERWGLLWDVRDGWEEFKHSYAAMEVDCGFEPKDPESNYLGSTCRYEWSQRELLS
ncbi:unnamed protein product [Peniophora sp. CBMAI 1063]|nr:unnamed protein product [Peniophora sp. CBMAI 1063]